MRGGNRQIGVQGKTLEGRESRREGWREAMGMKTARGAELLPSQWRAWGTGSESRKRPRLIGSAPCSPLPGHCYPRQLAQTAATTALRHLASRRELSRKAPDE